MLDLSPQEWSAVQLSLRVAVVATLDTLSSEKGARFEPAPLLVECAKSNRTLYGKE